MGKDDLLNFNGPFFTLSATQWKQYLTTMQIGQFLVILASAAFASECRSLLSLRMM